MVPGPEKNRVDSSLYLKNFQTLKISGRPVMLQIDWTIYQINKKINVTVSK